MLKLILAFGLVFTLGASEPPATRPTPPVKPAAPLLPPPPPLMPAAADCWRDFFVNISACQHDFEGTDRIVVAQRRSALQGAAAAFNSCLNLVPAKSPPTDTPDAPAGSRAWTCLEQLVIDIKDCRTKFSPGVPVLQGDPERDTMKNAFDQCLGGAVGKNGWCNGRRPNNPVQPLTQINILNAPVMAAAKDSVTLTVLHTAPEPVDIYWYAAVFNNRSELVSQQALGMTARVPSTPTEITLPMSGVGEDGVDVVVLGRAESAADPIGINGGARIQIH